jgi:hypothetical protein
MATKRERLDSLTAKIRGNIDVGASVDPAVVGSLAHMDAEIAANQAAIAVITAIAANSAPSRRKPSWRCDANCSPCNASSR